MAHFIIIIYQWGIEVCTNSKPGGEQSYKREHSSPAPIGDGRG